MAKQPRPNLGQWKRAYGQAWKLRKLAPWEWMHDGDIFGFEDPETGSQYFISIMGNLGQHYAMAVYPGAENLYQILKMYQPGSESEKENIFFRTGQIQLSFEDRDYLESQDLLITKWVGLERRLRGPNAWPCFRNTIPGRIPWFVGKEELRILMLAIEQILEVAPRLRDALEEVETMLVRVMAEHKVLMRVPVQEGGELRWEEHVKTIEPPPPRVFACPLEDSEIERLRKFPVSDNEFEVALQVVSEQFVHPNEEEAPYAPWLAVAIETEAGSVAGHKVLIADPSIDVVFGGPSQALVEALAATESRPKAVAVKDEESAALVAETCRRLDIPVRIRNLDHVNMFFRALADFTEGSGL